MTSPPCARCRVDGEHHTGARGEDLALHDDRDVDVGERQSALSAVGQGARAEQRRPAASHRVDDGIRAADVQERLVHAGERRRRGVLRCRGRSHGHDGVAVAGVPERVIAAADGPHDRVGNRFGVDELARVARRRLERVHIVGVETLQPARAGGRADRPPSTKDAKAGAPTTKPSGTCSPRPPAPPGWPLCRPRRRRRRGAAGRSVARASPRPAAVHPGGRWRSRLPPGGSADLGADVRLAGDGGGCAARGQPRHQPG